MLLRSQVRGEEGRGGSGKEPRCRRGNGRRGRNEHLCTNALSTAALTCVTHHRSHLGCAQLQKLAHEGMRGLNACAFQLGHASWACRAMAPFDHHGSSSGTSVPRATSGRGFSRERRTNSWHTRQVLREHSLHDEGRKCVIFHRAARNTPATGFVGPGHNYLPVGSRRCRPPSLQRALCAALAMQYSRGGCRVVSLLGCRHIDVAGVCTQR